MRPMRFADLFAGIGGFHLGLGAKAECVFASEIDTLAAEAYQANFGVKPVGDIRAISVRDIPHHDILCAGFPCQSFSIAGRQAGLEDERGQLFFEIIRVAKHCRPRVLILENVRQILTIEGGAVKRQICHSLDDIGYYVHYVILNSGCFGIPQKRIRAYFIALRKDSCLEFFEPKPQTEFRVVANIMKPPSEVTELWRNREDLVFSSSDPETPQRRLVRIGQVGKGRVGERVYSTMGWAPTQVSDCGGLGRTSGLFHVGEKIVRRLHLDEVKQVMGFPKKHLISEGKEGYAQLGNAVVPEMIRQIYNSISL